MSAPDQAEWLRAIDLDTGDSLARIQRLWRSGKPIFREAARFRELAGSVVPMPQVDWFSELLHDPSTRGELEGFFVRRADPQAVFVCWLGQQFRKVSDTSNWFRVTEGLAYKLLATDLRGAVVGDLKLPVPAFYIEIPPDLFWLKDPQTGWHEVRMLSAVTGRVTERTLALAKAAGDESADAVNLGERLVIEAYGEPNKNSVSPFDDTWIFKSYRTEDKDAEIDYVLENSNDEYRLYEKNLNVGRIGNQEVDGWKIREMLIRFVLNLCIYMGSEKATVEHTHAAEIERLSSGKKFKNLRKHIQDKVRALQNDRLFVVGTDITVSPEMRELVRNEGSGTHALSYRTLVRGHWRNQAHGPGYALRTRRWIEPHIRGNELPTKVVGHNYNVK
jgi:hypothetical protein